MFFCGSTVSCEIMFHQLLIFIKQPPFHILCSARSRTNGIWTVYSFQEMRGASRQTKPGPVCWLKDWPQHIWTSAWDNSSTTLLKKQLFALSSNPKATSLRLWFSWKCVVCRPDNELWTKCKRHLQHWMFSARISFGFAEKETYEHLDTPTLLIFPPCTEAIRRKLVRLTKQNAWRHQHLGEAWSCQ